MAVIVLTLLLLPRHFALPGAIEKSYSVGTTSGVSSGYQEPAYYTEFEISDEASEFTEQLLTNPDPELCDHAIWVSTIRGLEAECVVGGQIITGSVFKATDADLADTTPRSFATEWTNSFTKFEKANDTAARTSSGTFQFDEFLTPQQFEPRPVRPTENDDESTMVAP